MINSCLDCTTKCCKTGPGPYKTVTAREYLDSFGDTSAYNTKCESLGYKGKCKAWGTPKFPAECRVYVCQNRKFSKKELATIAKVHDGQECGNCGTTWQIERGVVFGRYLYHCEVCGNDWYWERKGS